MQTLKALGYWKLNKYSQLKYFKNGRANMHVAVTYCLEFDNAQYFADHGVDLDVVTGVFWIKTKKDALKTFSEFKKTRCIGGAELKSELFNETKGA